MDDLRRSQVVENYAILDMLGICARACVCACVCANECVCQTQIQRIYTIKQTNKQTIAAQRFHTGQE